MNRFNFFVAIAVALIATGPACAYSSQGGGGEGGDYGGAEAGSGAAASAGDASGYGAPSHGYGGHQNIPYAPVSTRGNTVTSSITYPQNKGEILIHRPAAIIVKRPPTKVLVNHPPLVVKPAPVVLHKPPAVVMRKVFVKQHPRPVKVEPVYVNVVKPPAEKYFVNEKQQQLAAAQLGASPSGFSQIGGSGASANAGQGQNLGLLQGQNLGLLQGLGGGSPSFASAGSDGSAANAGYQLLQGNQGLAALANIGYGAPQQQQYQQNGY